MNVFVASMATLLVILLIILGIFAYIRKDKNMITVAIAVLMGIGIVGFMVYGITEFWKYVLN